MNVRRKKKESIHNDLVLRWLVTYVKSTWTELSRSCGQTVRVVMLKLARPFKRYMHRHVGTTSISLDYYFRRTGLF